MRSNIILSLAAIALGFGMIGASAGTPDNIPVRADLSAMRAPGGTQLNQGGLSALKDKSGHSALKAPSDQATTSTMTPQEAASSLLSSPAKVGAANLMQPPNPAAEQLLSTPLKSSAEESQSFRAPQ
jgi:hypothetical protein